jgi:hypothetical protein
MLIFFFAMSTGGTAVSLPIFTPDGSNDAVWPQKVPFAGHDHNILVLGTFSSQLSPNPLLIWLGVVKRTNVFQHILTKDQQTSVISRTKRPAT